MVPMEDARLLEKLEEMLDALDALEAIDEAEREGTISLAELRARLGRQDGACPTRSRSPTEKKSMSA